MSLGRWLTLGAALVLLRTIFTLFGPRGDFYLLALLVSAAISWETWRRRQADVVTDFRNQVAPISDSPGLNPPSADGATLPDPEPEVTHLVFTYPPDSRFRAWLAVLLSGTFGIGFLSSVAFHPEDDPANGWMLFVFGVLCLIGLAISVWQLSWIGASLAVSREELIHRAHNGRLARIPWTALARITLERFPKSIAFLGRDGTTIRIYSNIGGFPVFLRTIGTLLGIQLPGAS